MTSARRTRVLFTLLAGVSLASSTWADRQPHAGMMRNPDVSATDIVFSYANDLWLVPRTGGMARPLASPPGRESFARFSPEGTTIAFVGNYEGNSDLYTIGVNGGIAERVTHHPGTETLCDWTPAGHLLFFANDYERLARQTQLYTVAAGGGLPERLPVPYGANAAVSADGTWLAYTPHSRDHHTWKRYRGGMATDIWLFNLEDHTSRKITDWEGTDSQPMWHEHVVYYLSDSGPQHRLNIWSFDTRSATRRQITRFEEYDVKWPSIGPGAEGDGEIVFQNGADLYLLDLATERATPVTVSVPGDRPTLRPQREHVHSQIRGYDLSATGKRGVFEARGDVWSVPAHKGSPQNLTRTSGVAERQPSWSPDGRWIAYFSDETGEYELYITQSDGKGETRRLTDTTPATNLPGDAAWQVYRYAPTWSPDSEHIAFTDKAGRIFIHTLDDGETLYVDQEPWARQQALSWSHDGSWIAYTRGGANMQSSVWLYDVKAAQKHQVTSGLFNDTHPTFDREGDYLFFASNRRFADPIYEDIGNSFVYTETDVLVMVPLRDDVASPWLLEVDEEPFEVDDEDEDAEEEDQADADDANDTENGESEDPEADEDTPADEETADENEPADDEEAEAEEEEEDDEGEDEDDEEDEEDEEDETLAIDLDGFEARAMRIPVDHGAFYGLSVNDAGHLIYIRRPIRGAPAIKIFDLTDEKRKEKTVLAGVGGYAMSADGKKLLVGRGGSYYVISAKAGQKTSKAMPMATMTATISPRAEWEQILRDAWRIQRDFFYVENMHGVDWDAIYEQYHAMLDDCVSRADVSYIIREMISELNIGHAYYFGGDVEGAPQVSVGMLGVDFELHDGAYRIARIIGGGPWDLDARSPLSEPGIHVRAGDYLLAVNGVPVDPTRDPWAAFQGLAGQTITLTFSDQPVLERNLDMEEKDAEEEETVDDEDGEDDEEVDEDSYAGQREIIIKPLGNEMDLRYRDWVEHNRRYVEERSDGRVGYIHVPDTGINGQNELFRQFYGQRDKQALIIDERWNGGGQLPHRFIELLNRPPTNFWARRDGRDWPSPDDAHFGPKCMLINGLAGSGGDMLPWLFRFHDLGPLIGMRTWGGLVGISGNPALIDGGYTSVPTFGFYELDGTWGVEGHGVDPDIEVVDDPAKMVDGSDPQLDKAIELMLKAADKYAFEPPKRPADPDRSGMGLPKEEH